MRRRAAPAAVVLALAGLACAAPAPAPPPRANPDLAASLVQLGQDALERGNLGEARGRFERALEADPGSMPARLGLAWTALDAGREAEAERRFRGALAAAPEAAAAAAHRGLGEVARRQGRLRDARAHLERAVAADPWSPEAHAALAAVTGPAPAAAERDAPLEVARSHPYDLRAGLRAAVFLAGTDRVAEAIEELEGVIWLADTDPTAAAEALELLAELSPAWRERPVVAVHSYVDETLRVAPSWPFRIRLAWFAVSHALQGVLDVALVPGSIAAFDASRADASLPSIRRAFEMEVSEPPQRGIVALFTGREAPRRPGSHAGQAQFLGRQLIVRLEPDGGPSRVLAHEVLHLFGAAHMTPDVPSLMDPNGSGLDLDPLNARIIAEVRHRRFEGGGVDRDVLPWIDLERTIAAYEELLELNLGFRRLGVAEALEAAERSRTEASHVARRVGRLDPHLGDVSRFIAALMLRDERPGSAILLLELASRLYGPRTPQGRDAREAADALLDAFKPPG